MKSALIIDPKFPWFIYLVLPYIEDVCMQIWSRAQTVLGLEVYGPQNISIFSLPFTVSYGLPKPSIEPAQGRFHPTFLAEMKFPILLPLKLAQASLRHVWHPQSA